ncbi:hypothetical protein JCGZ_17428 [Jatropha curcas]|uniref:CDT1 Geminin-binding domain-containing protein n=1 Tax=Jatropha curcas TaxID=180498 RepID=A0A067LBH1_JATCU|nr:CDT1-like protein b [Jatropha curcas]KDP45821.1 hypothetical protein JCGZ_17428 [Jatropha curcas]
MDGCRQNVLDSNSKKVIDAIDKATVHFPSPQKLGIAGNQNWESKFASQTPEKTNQSLNAKPKEAEVELLERHKAIIELFDSMTCSLRLLGLRKKSPTFQNICTQVEVLTRRKFSYGHLAQLKYLLHEAIQIDKILVHDKKTLCMKPEMEITLVFNEIEGHHEQSDFIALHQLFASRLTNYFTVHPEACDIPEAILPDPFNQSKRTAFGGEVSDIPEVKLPEPVSQSQTFATEQLLANASTEDLPTTVESEPPSKSSHMHPSFSRHFSEKIITEKDKTQLLTSSVPLSSVPSNMKNQDTEISKTTEHPDPSSKSDSETNLNTKYEQGKESPGTNSTSTTIHPILVQAINPQFSIDNNACGSPMWKLASSADNLMVETPAQSTPKRATPLSDDNHKSVASQKQASSSCTAAKRSLDFSLLEGNESACCEFLPDNISQTVDGSSAILQKVDESFGCDTEELKMSPSDFLHQQISVYLPRLVSLIHRIFQSVNYSTITKEELVHKIIVNSFDFDERRQVEEQIEILEKLVPDWICMKLAPSGDVLYCIKKASDLNSVQSRVAMIKSN